MLAHLFKMLWNRKRKNALITLEISVAFMVVFALAAVTIRFTWLYHQPLGFEYKNMWWVAINNPAEANQQRDNLTLKQMITELTQLSEVETVQVMTQPAFTNWNWTTGYRSGDVDLWFFSNQISDGAAEAFGMQLQQGRWFGEQDVGQNYTAVVVNQHFVNEYYPGENIIGKNIASTENPDSPAREKRVVGVFTDFRQQGELASLKPYAFHRFDLEQDLGKGKDHFQLKLNQNVDASFEGKIVSLLRKLNPEWDYYVKSWQQSRESQLKEALIPIILLGTIAIFLIIMVAMGLFGVLWQNVSRRTREIGLRRALGATARSIHWQVIGELLVICSIGVTLAMLILVQLPLLGVIPELKWPLFISATLVAIMFMVLLSLVCAFYPGKVATAYTPAEALHYE